MSPERARRGAILQSAVRANEVMVMVPLWGQMSSSKDEISLLLRVFPMMLSFEKMLSLWSFSGMAALALMLC